MNRDQEDSFTLQESSQRAPLFKERFYKNTNPLLKIKQAKLNGETNKFKCINGIQKNKINKLVLSQELQQFLLKDESNYDLTIVSVVGEKKIGKSFLVDCIISVFQQKTLRGMSKNIKGQINCPNILLKKNNDERILFLDMNGSCGDEEFLWAYFLSNVMIFNLQSNDEAAQNKFYSKLAFINSHLQYETQNFSLPKLLVIERDANLDMREDTGFSSYFNEKIAQTGLFDGNLVFMRLPYPGDETVKSKELLDVSQKNLNKSFLTEIKNIKTFLESTKPKAINNNYMTSKLLSLTLEPLTKKINKDRRVKVENIWEEVIDSLSVGFYNYYIMKYSQQLLRQFQQEKPLEKYQLYKKLRTVKRSIDKKVEGFNNIAGDPIFQKYKDKLRETIEMKEKMIKEVNRAKSRNQNQKLMQNLLQGLKGNNIAEIIKKYCQGSLDDEKIEVMVENFDKVLKQRSIEVQQSKKPTNIATQIKNVQSQLQRLQQQISQEQNLHKKLSKKFDFDSVKNTRSYKDDQINKLKQLLDQQLQKNGLKQQKKKQFLQREHQIQQLKQKTKQQEAQINAFQNEKKRKIREAKTKVEEQFKQQEKKLKQLQERLKNAKRKPQSANTCCCCVIM